jgi:hypothetical protein
MKANYTYLLLTIVMALPSTTLRAQVTDTLATIDSLALDSIPLLDGINVDDVEVIKAFSAKLSDASSIKVQPVVPTTPARNVKYDYDVTIVPLELEYPDPVIKPYAMRPDPVQDQYRGFVEAGYGTVSNPHARAGYSVQGDKVEIQAIAGYDALDTKTGEANVQRMQRLYGDVAATVAIGDHHRYQGQVNAGLETYAVFDNRLNVPTAELKAIDRNFNRVAISNAWDTRSPVNGWDYGVNLRTSYLEEDYQDLTEIGNVLDLHLDKNQSDLLSYHLNGRAWAILNMIDDTEDMHLGGHLTPYVSLQKDRWWGDIGADVYIGDSPIFWPRFEVGVDVGSGSYQPYVGTRLNTEVHSNHHIQAYNPYASNPAARTTAARSIYLGMRGQVRRLSYDATASYDQVADHLFFNPNYDEVSEGLFEATYLDANVVTVKAHAELRLLEYVSIGGTLRQRIFDMADEDESPWGQPLFELDAYSKIDLLSERLVLRPSLHLASIATYGPFNNPANGLIDFSLHADYKLGERFSIYGQANNLLDNEYQRWVGYPTVGINFAGGVKVKF